MIRFALLVMFAPVAVAAPVPKPTEKQKIERWYGTIENPKGDCQFALTRDGLTVTLPADEVRDVTDEADTAPRLVREVAGDFVLTVRVHVPLTAGVGQAEGMKGADPFLMGGVQLRCGEENRFGLSLSRKVDGKGVTTGLPFQLQGDAGGIHSAGDGEVKLQGVDAMSFRFTRRGAALATELSADGKKWHRGFGFDKLMCEDKVKVALVARHGSSREHAVTFSECVVEPLPAGEKK